MGGGDGDAFVAGDEVAWLQFFTEVPAAVITGSRHDHGGESVATGKHIAAKCRCRATLHIERRQAGAATKGPSIDGRHAGRKGYCRQLFTTSEGTWADCLQVFGDCDRCQVGAAAKGIATN